MNDDWNPIFLFSLKLQELEVENGKMRDDLKKLRDALSDEAGEDNAQFKEMIGELVPDGFFGVLYFQFETYEKDTKIGS